MTETYKGIRARGDSLIIDFNYMGHRCRETIKARPTKTALKEASRKREAILYEISMGCFDYAKHFPSSKNALKFARNKGSLITVEKALLDWLQNARKHCQPSTIRGYSSCIYYHLIPTFGHLNLSEISVHHIRDWVSELNISNKRINNILGPLRQTLKEAVYDDLIQRNPLDRFRYLSVQKQEPEPFTPLEIEAILSQLQGQEKNLIQFAFWSGLRTSELIGLRWQDVDFDNEKIHVRIAVVRGKSKSTKTAAGQRSVELQVEAYKALKNQRSMNQDSEIVFLDPQTLNPWKGDHIIRKRVWIPALKAAQVKYRKPYQTRHTFASMLLSSGRNPLWVAQQMGHKDWGMIRQVYGRWMDTSVKGDDI